MKTTCLTIIYLVLLSKLSYCSMEKWTKNVDAYYNSTDVVVRHTHISDEYKFIRQLYPLDLEQIQIKDFILTFRKYVERENNGLGRSSDVFLGYLYCEKVGINSSSLLVVFKKDELLLTYVVAGLLFGFEEIPHKPLWSDPIR